MGRHSQGYIVLGNGTLEHVVIAEQALGHALPPKAEVHHVNGKRADNSRGNLVICPDRAYHMMLHLRERALDACGNPNHRRCTYCKQWDDPNDMAMRNKGQHGIQWRHRACHVIAVTETRNRRRLRLSHEGRK
jgi:hypothetical protein